MTEASKPGEEATGPDFRQIDKSVARQTEFPVATVDEFRVHITDAAYDRMKAHAAVSDEVELGGVLIGDVCRDRNGFFLNVTAVIEGEGANNYGSQVTFTHETWNHINTVKDREHPKKKIVGWYHTHPGFGVFLSSMDSFIQENFFSQPYQIAIVLETKQHVEGCFHWVKGEAQPLRRYWIGDRLVDLTDGDVEPFEGQPTSSSGTGFGQNTPVTTVVSKPPEPLLNMSVLLMIVFALLCGGMLGYIRGQQASLEALASEYCSVLEFGSLNALAAEDLKDVREKMDVLATPLQKGQDPAALDEFNNLQQLLLSMEKDYRRRGMTYRDDMREIAQTRMGMRDQQRQLTSMVVALWFMRLQDMLRAADQDPSLLPESDRIMLKATLDKMLKMDPANKDQLRTQFPKLFKYFYSEPEPLGPPDPTGPGASSGTRP